MSECAEKKPVDLLIVGDSLVKWLDPSKISSGETIHECLPGGRIKDVKNKIKKVCNTVIPKNLFICCGSNHIPEQCPETVSRKLLSMVKEVKENLPNTNIFVNSILPKIDETYSPGMQSINKQLLWKCKKLGVDLVYNKQFWLGELFNYNLLARDKIHLSKKGVATLGSNIKYRLRKVNANS